MKIRKFVNQVHLKVAKDNVIGEVRVFIYMLRNECETLYFRPIVLKIVKVQIEGVSILQTNPDNRTFSIFNREYVYFGAFIELK